MLLFLCGKQVLISHSLALINREGVRVRDGKDIQGTSAVYSWITSVHGLNIGVYFDFIIDFHAGFCQYLMFGSAAGRNKPFKRDVPPSLDPVPGGHGRALDKAWL